MRAQRRDIVRFEVPLGVLGGALVALSFAFAATGIPRWIPPAPMVRLGVASPLTGMTRSFVATAGGDLGAAFVWHPLGPICFVACVAAAAYATIAFARSTRSVWVGRMMGTRWFGVSVAAAFALCWARQIKEVSV